MPTGDFPTQTMAIADEGADMAAVTEEFVARLRNGESPSIDEFKQRFPTLAQEIDDVFPALEMLERCRPEQKHEQPRFATASIPDRLGEYRILQEIGRGGMGIVYMAEHETMFRRVALKVLPQSAHLDQTQLSRFHREARAAGQMHHSNIVPVFEVGEDQGIHFYAMQFIRGQNLDLVIDEVKRLFGDTSDSRNLAPSASRSVTVASTLITGRREEPVSDVDSQFTSNETGGGTNDDAVGNAQINKKRKSVTSEWSSGVSSRQDYFRRVASIGLQVVDALAYAHHNGVLHRDIKPSNLILDTEGTVWMTDFGLAQNDEEALTTTGDIVGTLRYMAPERFEGEADARSDLYSLGLTLYEMCTMRHAFDHSNRVQLVEQVTQRTPTRPRKIDDRIPRDLETIILKAIEREPSRRYQSAQQLAEDLQLFLSDRPVLARRASTLERCWRVCRRNPVPSLMGGLIAALLLVVAVGAVWFGVSRDLQNEELQLETQRARRAESNAVKANHNSRYSLYRSYVSQSQAMRRSRGPGQHFETLATIRKAVKLLPNLQLSPEQREQEELRMRDSAVAAMALPDVRVDRQWKLEDRWGSVAFDVPHRRYASSDANGNISIRRVDRQGPTITLANPVRQRAWTMKFSPDGRYFVSRHHPPNGRPLSISVWDLQRPSKPLIHITNDLYFDLGYEFAHKQPWFAVSTFRNGINIYSLKTGKMIRHIDVGYTTSSLLKFSHDDTRLLSAQIDAHSLQIWKVTGETEQLQKTLVRQNISAIAWDDRHNTIAVGTHFGNIFLWRKQLRERPRELTVHRARVTQLFVHPSGEYLLSGSWDRTVRAINLASANEQLVIDRATLFPTGFSPDGKRIGFLRNQEGFGIWRVAESPLTTIQGNRASVWSVDFHPTNRRVIARGTHEEFEIRDVLTRKTLHSLKNGQYVRFSPSGDALYLSGSDGLSRRTVKISNSDGGGILVEFGEPKKILDKRTTRFTFANNGRDVVVVSKSTAYWINGQTGAVRRKFTHPGLATLAVTSDSKYLLTGTWKGLGVRVWNAETGVLKKTLKRDWYGASVATSPRDNLAVSTDGGKIAFWRIPSLRSPGWRETKRLPGGSHSPIQFSPDGRFVVVSFSNQIPQLIDATTGRPLFRLEARDKESLYSYSFSSDGSHLAIGCDSNVQIWRIDWLKSRLADLGLECPPSGNKSGETR